MSHKRRRKTNTPKRNIIAELKKKRRANLVVVFDLLVDNGLHFFDLLAGQRIIPCEVKPQPVRVAVAALLVQFAAPNVVARQRAAL